MSLNLNCTFYLHIQTLTLIVYVNISAQTPVLPRYVNSEYGEIENAYYKDIENFHEQYEGTWLYSNGNTSLKLVFQKKNMVLINGYLTNYYEDVLIGEYIYVTNGIEKINTLSNLNINHTDVNNYNLYSVSKIRSDVRPKCSECSSTEFRLNLFLNEPFIRNIDGHDNDFIIRRFFDNGVEKLKVWFVKTDNGVYSDKNTQQLINFNGYALPFGEYVLIKQ
jgi:hypothetical protein